MKFLPVLFALVLIGCSSPPSSAQTAPAPDRAAGPVGEVSITNDARKPLAPRAFSFGQIFSPGTVAVGDAVDVVVDGKALPTQIDAKALNADGSVRHAVVTVELPELRGGQSLAATLVNKLKAPGPARTEYAPTPDLSVALELEVSGQKRTVAFNLPAVVQAAGGGKPDEWLNGPIALERRYAVDVDRRLQIIFDVLTPRSGPSRVDVIFCNDWNDIKLHDDVKYDVSISMAGKTVYAARGVSQYPYSTWHHLVWSDDAESPRAAPKVTDLIAAGAVPRYDTKFDFGEMKQEIAADVRSLSSAPLSPGSVTTGMGTTGGRMDIGPLPTWAVVDLLDSDATSRHLLLANADASGAAPWHIRERTTKLPLTTDKYPDLWLDTRTHSIQPLAQPYEEGVGAWGLDSAHQPSLTFLPYLVTGLRYYKDELRHQAAFVLLAYNNGYRSGSDALIAGADEQARGIAWSLRTLATAAYILPKNDPMQPYFDAKLRGNLAYLTQKYVAERRLKAAGAIEGWVEAGEGVAPWQQGFIATTLGWINNMGYADAGRLLDWMSHFLAGLYTSKAEGFDPRYGTQAGLNVREPGENGPYYSTWKALFDANKLAEQSEAGREEVWSYYGMIMRAALGSAYAVNHDPKTKAAYDFVTRTVGASASRGDPTFAIVPP